jgi:hypothetical protein
MALPTAPFNTAKSIFAGKSVIQLKIAPALSGVTAATTVITTLAAHGLSIGQQVIFVSGTGFTGLTAGLTYYVVLVPLTTTFSVSATSGGSAIAVGTSSAGVFQPIVIFESRLLNSKPTQEVKKLQRPDAAGVLRTVRQVRTSSEESFTYEMDEGKRLLEIFSGALSGFVTATCTLWLPDPADSTGNVALKSETDFTCTVTGDGDTKFGDSDFTKPSIMITSTKAGAITWTADGAA